MIGNKLFDYEITRKIKAGGMGVVYEARRVWGKRERVAVKFLLEQLRDDENIRRRFLREAEILEMLSHPRIVKILGLDPDRDAFVMEFIEGKTLSEHLRKSPEVFHNSSTAVEMFAQLLDAFDYAHHVVIELEGRREQGVVHRDIKPSNIIIEPDGSPKILDFGISRISTFESTLTDPKLQMGSVAYMSPEQIVNPAAVDWRSDIYALGVNLWELFAGRPPYPQVTNFDMVIQVQNSIRNEPLPLLTQLKADAGPEKLAFLKRIDSIVAKATTKDPAQRYQRCSEMRDALLATLQPEQPSALTDVVDTSLPTPGAVSPDDSDLQSELARPSDDLEPMDSDWNKSESMTRIQTPTPPEEVAAIAAQLPLTPDGSFRPVVDPTHQKPVGNNRSKILYAAIGLVLVAGGIIWWKNQPVDDKKTTKVSDHPFATDSTMSTIASADSCYEVGNNYYFGQNGTTKDFKQAAYWYQKAADLGNSDSQRTLGSMYQNGLGVAKDYTQAVKWFRASAGQGNAIGQNNLGYMYTSGLGVTKDYTEALKWFRASAEQGDADGRSNLGVMYDQGNGVREDNTEAMKWYLRAANQNYPPAQYYVGTMYELGEGVPKDVGKAIQWYKLAARQGNRTAQDQLRRLQQTN